MDKHEQDSAREASIGEYGSSDAIEILEQQHREVEDLFAQFEEAQDDEERETLFLELADALAIHATIEERHFYPAVKDQQTEEQLKEAHEEHKKVKRQIAELLGMGADDDEFVEKVAALRQCVDHHVGEEEGELFPKCRELLDEEELEAIGQEMIATASELEGTDARNQLLELDSGEPRLQ